MIEISVTRGFGSVESLTVICAVIVTSLSLGGQMEFGDSVTVRDGAIESVILTMANGERLVTMPQMIPPVGPEDVTSRHTPFSKWSRRIALPDGNDCAGTLTQTVTVYVKGEKTKEVAETFLLKLSGALNATLANTQATGTIQNDD